jgi:hypothetical protein
MSPLTHTHRSILSSYNSDSALKFHLIIENAHLGLVSP